MDVVTYILSKKYTDAAVIAAGKGLDYKGSVAKASDLPTPAESNRGHMYTISGTDQPDYGHEYVSDATQWIDLGADLALKADKVDLQNEINTRAEADLNLNTKIDNEESARISSYNNLNEAINQEGIAREQADVTLQNNINGRAYLPEELPPELKVPGVDYPWFMVNMNPTGIDADGNLHLDHSGYNFNNRQYYTWKDKVIPMAATTATGGVMTAADKVKLDSAITEHQDVSGKLNVLPKVDDPTDPGYGWEYHIPYRFDVSLDAEKANVDLHTLTLDNKLTKMTFNKQIPSATTVTAGLMSSADKTALNGKLNILPLVDDPEDPGFGWEYHIPYNFEATPDAEKLNIKLKTLTLDNKFTKMNFDKALPAATTETAGLMSAADKVALNGKQDALTAGKNITIADNVIKANSEFIELTGTSGTLTDEQFAVINDNNDAYISLNRKQFRFSSVVVGRSGVEATYANSTGTDADVIIININSKAWTYVATQLQPKLTAGENITIENNVISATGGSSVAFDEKTIIKGSDDKYETAIGGWKETAPEQTQELFVNTPGTGLPTYVSANEIGWDYTPTITSLVGTATEALVDLKVTVLGATFNNRIALYKQSSFPVMWESNEILIGEYTYKIKVGDNYVGANNGGIGLLPTTAGLEIEDSVMESFKLVISSAADVYHPIDNRFLKLDNESIVLDANGALKALGGTSYTAGSRIDINDNVINVKDDLTVNNLTAVNEIHGNTQSGNTLFNVGPVYVSGKISPDKPNAISGKGLICLNLKSGKSLSEVGENVVIVGTNCYAKEQSAFASGTETEAIASYAFASGYQTSAKKPQSFASGKGTIANRHSQMAIGQYNVSTDDKLFVIGNGTDDSSRSNALTVDTFGNVVTAGTVNGIPAIPTADGDYKLHIENGVATWVEA